MCNGFPLSGRLNPASVMPNILADVDAYLHANSDTKKDPLLQMVSSTTNPRPQGLQHHQQQQQQQQITVRQSSKSGPVRRSLRPGKTAKSHERHFVRHDYHDHAMEGPNDILPVMQNPIKSGRRGPRGGVSTPFPERLHEMLICTEEDGQADIVSWQPHGRCFVVHKPKVFVSDIMPIYFRQSKLTSFQRQLNLYGFSRLTSGDDRGGYYHELFLRGRPFLCKRMVRTRVKGTGIKAASNPETEPNFYSMPFVDRDFTHPPAPVKQERVTTNNITPPASPHLQPHTAELEPCKSMMCYGNELPQITTSLYQNTAPVPMPAPTSSFIPMETSSLSMPSSWSYDDDDKSTETIEPTPLYEFVEDLHANDEVMFEGKIFHYLDSSSFEEPLNHQELDDDSCLGRLLDEMLFDQIAI